MKQGQLEAYTREMDKIMAKLYIAAIVSIVIALISGYCIGKYFG